MRAKEFITEKWSAKYKRSINCSDPKGFSQKAHCAGRKKNESVTEGYSDTTFQTERRRLNVPALIKAGALFVTWPHGEQGWETDNQEDWAFSLLSLYNVLQGGWQSEAKKYIKPESYKRAEQQINSSAPNLGSDKLVYDGKYNQILWSIKKLGIPDNVAFLDNGTQGMAEGVPQPGESSGAPKQFGPDAKIESRHMTVKQIISSIPGVPYYNNVVDDWDAKDYSWGVTKKVIEYATYLKDHPESLSQLPPILVLNGKFEDGAHRVSAIWLLQQRMDPKNPLWANAKLNVQFVKQGVAEGLEQDYLSQVPNLIWKPVSRSVWNTIQDEGLDEEQDAPTHTDWVMASLTISPEDAQALQAFDSDAIEDFNRFDIHLKSRYPGLTDLIDYDNGTVTIVKPSREQGVAENFADGKVKGKSRPGRVKRAGASCAGSVTDLRAKAKKYSGEKAKMYHWCANMKGGKK